VIEIDGEGHDMGDQPERDGRRDEWLETQGLKVVRVPAAEVMANAADVADGILRLIGEQGPPIVAHRRSRGSPATLPPARGGKSE